MSGQRFLKQMVSMVMALAIVLLYGLPGVSVAQAEPTKAELIKKNFSYQDGRAGNLVRKSGGGYFDASDVMAEIASNKGVKDNVLANHDWDKFEQYVKRAEGWIRVCRRFEFELALDEIQKMRRTLRVRRRDLKKLREKVNKDFEKDRKEFERQMKRTGVLQKLGIPNPFESEGPHKIKKEFGKKAVTKGGTYGVGKGIQKGSEKLAEKGFEKSGLAAKCFGRALGIVGLVKDLGDLGIVTDSAIKMQAMMPRLLKLMEQVAYLDALIQQYDDLIAAQDKLLKQLSKAYSDHACRKCVSPGESKKKTTGTTTTRKKKPFRATDGAFKGRQDEHGNPVDRSSGRGSVTTSGGKKPTRKRRKLSEEEKRKLFEEARKNSGRKIRPGDIKYTPAK